MRTVLFFLLLCIATSSFAQNTAEGVEMADAFRSEGKIYVVVAVVVTILLGIGYYLWSMDKRLTRLEKEQRERTKGK